VPALTAVLDACVLYRPPLRDLLMNLALVDLFQARWTDAILTNGHATCWGVGRT